MFPDPGSPFLLFPAHGPEMLTDAQCRNATCPPDKKRARLTDAAGLYLEISPGGSKRWFLKLYRDGKETRLALGSYPKTREYQQEINIL